jgi:hypothetical protein
MHRKSRVENKHSTCFRFQILICRTVKCDSVRKFLRRFFQKATADPTRGALVASAEAKHFFGISFLLSFFLCASGVKEKSGHKV